MENRYVMEMLNRQRIEEIHRIADRDRLVRQARDHGRARPLWTRVIAVFEGGRIRTDASGSRQVPGL